MKNLVAENNTIQKLYHARYYSIKDIPGPTNVCSTKERRRHSRTQKRRRRSFVEHTFVGPGISLIE